MSFLDDILKKIKGVNATIKNNVQTAQRNSNNFFTQKINAGLDKTFSTSRPDSINNMMGRTLTNIGTSFERETANPENPILGGGMIAQQERLRRAKKYLRYGTISPQEFSKIKYEVETAPVLGMTDGARAVTGVATKAGKAVLKKAAEVAKPVIKKATDKLLYTAKPPSIPTNSTPLPANLEDIYRKADDAKLQTSLDDLFNKTTLKTPEGTKVPIEKSIPKKGSFTPLNNKKLEENYLNLDSGLPAEGLPAGAASKGNALSYIGKQNFIESSKVIDKMGQAGRQLVKRLFSTLDDAERAAGGKVSNIQHITEQLSDADFDRVAKGLQGRSDGLPTDHPLVSTMRKVLDEVLDDARKVGIDVKKLDNYYPQLPDKDKLAKNIDAAAQYFVDTKQFKSYDDAAGFIQDYVNGENVVETFNKFTGKSLSKNTNLEFQRILDWFPDVLRTDKQVVADYLTRAYNRIYQVKNFGSKNQVGENLIKQLERQGYDAQTARTIMERSLGINPRNAKAEKLSNIARTAQAIIKLPLAAITNVNQTVNTASSFGTSRVLREVGEYLMGGKKLKELKSLKSGATLEATLREINDQWVGTGSIISKIAAPFFKDVEKFNRVIAANTGMRAATDWFSKLLKNPNNPKLAERLRGLGIDVQAALQRGALTNEELLIAGQKAVKRTQFKTRALDLPATWSSPGGKVATQFKSFGFKHGQFIRDELLKPLTKGNPIPLTTYLLLGGVVIGEGTNDVKAFINRKERPTDPVERFTQNITAVGGLGLYQSLLESAEFGYEGLAGFFLGPTGDDILTTGTNIAKSAQGNPEPLMRQAVSSIPFIGRPLVNTNKETFTSSGTDTTLDDIFTSGGDPEELDKALSEFEIGPAAEEKLDSEIKDLNKKRKEVIEKDGFNIPLLGNVGGLSEEDRNTQVKEIDKVIKTLKGQKELQGVEEYLQPNPETGIKKYEWQNDQYEWGRKVFGSDITDTQKQELIGRMGLKVEDVSYDYLSRQTTQAKSGFLYEQLRNVEHDKVIETLIQGRMEGMSGSMVAANETLADLRDKGLISSAEYKQLIKYKFDGTGKNIGTSAYSGGGGGGATKTALNALAAAFAKGRASRSKSLKSIFNQKTTKKTKIKSSLGDILKSKRNPLKVSDKPVKV